MSILDGALRQFKHNDGSDGFVFAYDWGITDREFAHMECQLARAEQDRNKFQRQLAEVTKERDQLKAMLELADALRNKERAGAKDALAQINAAIQRKIDENK